MKWMLVPVLVLFAAESPAIQYESKSCEESNFLRGTWQQLVQIEPKIESFLAEIARESGEPGPEVPVTNCRVTWPIDEKGQATDGLRTVVIDKVWYSKGSPQVLSQGGMKIIYSRKAETTYDAEGNYCTRYNRIVRGLAFCRSVAVCRMLAIPFPEQQPRREEPTQLPPVDKSKRPELEFTMQGH